MRRLVLLALVFTSLVLFLGVVVKTAQQQPISEPVMLLHLTICRLPCWLNINIGNTDVGTVRGQIKKVYESQPNYEVKEDIPQFTVEDRVTGLTLGILLNSWTELPTDSTVVDKIELWENSPSGPQLTFSDLYPLLGDPDYVMLSGDEGTIFPSLLYYRHMIKVDIGDVMGTQIKMNPTVLKITLYSHMPAKDDWIYKPQPWRGFSTLYDLQR
jgi:hypothetical protein